MSIRMMTKLTCFLSSRPRGAYTVFAFSIALIAIFIITGSLAFAKSLDSVPAQISPIHPTFALLDESGENVLTSGKAVSTLQTCGACHDTDFIEQHSYHADLGLEDFSAPGDVTGGRSWDSSPGFFGKWNPLIYRYLSPQGDERIDLGTADWIKQLGSFHVGGGPAAMARDGRPLTDLPVTSGDPETNVQDPHTGQLTAWDWERSGTVEMNCFLCHTPAPDNQARIDELQAGNFRWANTATLLQSGIVDRVNGAYQYRADAFTDDGLLDAEFVQIQDPTNDNCGQCHGLVHDTLREPVILSACSAEQWRTQTTGQIISPQRLSDSGLNLADKAKLTRSWDIHAERAVNCTDCHFSLNNPVYFQEAESSRPEHLIFDPRRLELGEYLYQPLHQFARGQSAQSTVSPNLRNTMRRCESCHDALSTHTWLPYQDRHMEVVSCETCHIPQMYSAAFQQYDWTVVTADVSPNTECRGLEPGGVNPMTSLVTGYQPILMPQTDVDGNSKIAPFNLITSWFWVYGNPERPVRQVDLASAWLEGDRYPAEIMAAFDQNGDGSLAESELVLDNQAKVDLITARLSQLGLENPRIVGEVQPYSINHTVAGGDWAIRDCQACHGTNSRVTQPILLSSYTPGDVLPEFVASSNTLNNGRMYQTEAGALYYQPLTRESNLYVLGHDSVAWVDLAGGLVFLGTMFGVVLHGGLRFFTSMRRPSHTPKLKKVYMYAVYERFWHWLQTFVILGLIFTGLVIHKPDTFGLFSFRYVVLVHNILAALLVINAGLSLFYHLVSGEIQQFLPRPLGFFDQAIVQARFYLRGIFKGDKHPFEKTPDKKLNPLQQVTYFAILNILLPLQIITGALMWGAQRWPNITNWLGGLPFLAPFHTLVAWLFAAFVVMHVYLTTTGHSPLASIQAMMLGWDEVEVFELTEEEAVS
jgi:thiosulfate reductase cytochrome b subunit